MTVGSGGSITLKEEDGLDYQATTVQLPGGERVPFLFTIKELDAKGTTAGFGGEFTVPSYRGATFLDPKGRGGATGYDNAVALPARSDSDEFVKENVKSTAALKGAQPATQTAHRLHMLHLLPGFLLCVHTTIWLLWGSGLALAGEFEPCLQHGMCSALHVSVHWLE